MVNKFIGKTPFEVAYSKPPCHTTDLLHLPASKNWAAKKLADKITKMIIEVRAHLWDSNAKYKAIVDAHRRYQSFYEGDLVMVHLNEHWNPTGENLKLKARHVGPCRVLAKINDNAFVIDIPLGWNIPHTFNVIDLTEHQPKGDES